MSADEAYHEYLRLVEAGRLAIDRIDLDAFADGVAAHRDGLAFHDNPDGDALTVRRLSWSIGWNERALRALRKAS